MNKIITHFKKSDPVLHSTILQFESLDFLKLEKSNDYFTSLCREIIGQQLAGAAARKIFDRFIALVPNKRITPEAILKIPEQKIRNAGLSWGKVRFIKDLAAKVKSGELDLDKLTTLENHLVATQLQKIKGIGQWTSEMFLMFALGREDVFSHGDYGLRKAIKKLYKFKKDPTKKQVEKLSLKWSPYRTYACLILWKSHDIKLPV